MLGRVCIRDEQRTQHNLFLAYNPAFQIIYPNFSALGSPVNSNYVFHLRISSFGILYHFFLICLNLRFILLYIAKQYPYQYKADDNG